MKELTLGPRSAGVASMVFDIDWELRLNFLVHDVARLRRQVVDRALKPLELTRSQWLVLVYLARSESTSQVALAEQMDIGKVTLGGLVDKLEAAGLVERKPDPVDRRLKGVAITAEGQRVIASIRERVSGEETQVLRELDDRDLEVTVKTLRGMKANLTEMLAREE